MTEYNSNTYGGETPPEARNGFPNVTALVKRGFLALEDGEFRTAVGFFEQALNMDAENAQAYLGKLMADLQVKRREDLKNCAVPFEGNGNCSKALRFGDEALRTELAQALRQIRERNENARREDIYRKAALARQQAQDEASYAEAERLFREIPGWRDADERAEECGTALKKMRLQPRLAPAQRREDRRRLYGSGAAFRADLRF